MTPQPRISDDPPVVYFDGPPVAEASFGRVESRGGKASRARKSAWRRLRPPMKEPKAER
jgi:hypothetical protein